MSSNVSALFKPQLPVKCQDPGSFTIPCTLGKITIGGALLDLGAAINVMPKSVYQALGVKNLKPTSVVLQLADRTIRYPDGIVEDILVKVKDLVFPADFYVLDMSKESISESTLILGRPFLRTANTMISMKEGSISMEVGDNKINFNIYEAMKHPHEDYSLLNISAIDTMVEEVCSEFGFENEKACSYQNPFEIPDEHHLNHPTEPPISSICSCKTFDDCTHALSVDSLLSIPYTHITNTTDGCMKSSHPLNSYDTSEGGNSFSFAGYEASKYAGPETRMFEMNEKSQEKHGCSEETRKPP